MHLFYNRADLADNRVDFDQNRVTRVVLLVDCKRKTRNTI
jgi:hypothetical protein